MHLQFAERPKQVTSNQKAMPSPHRHSFVHLLSFAQFPNQHFLHFHKGGSRFWNIEIFLLPDLLEIYVTKTYVVRYERGREERLNVLTEGGGAVKFSAAHTINCVLLKVLILNLKSKEILLTTLALAVHMGENPGGKFQ